MKSISKVLITLSICGLALGLCACGAYQETSSSDSSLTLKTYTVPQGQAKELSVTLDRVLSMGNDKHQIGKAWFSGSNQILVLAPDRSPCSRESSAITRLFPVAFLYKGNNNTSPHFKRKTINYRPRIVPFQVRPHDQDVSIATIHPDFPSLFLSPDYE